VMTRIRLQMKHVGNGMLRVFASSQENWDAQFAIFERYRDLEGFSDGRAQNPDYLVSWIDCFAGGAAAGRGLIHAAWYDEDAEKPEVYDLPQKILGIVPKSQMWRLLKPFNNRFGVRMINSAKHLSAKLIGNNKYHPQSLVEFSFLLDYVPNWRNAYLPGGFIQYQSFIPAEEAPRVFKKQVEMQQEEGLEAFLAVMKRHRKDDFMFSHGVDGYSLALDFKVTEANRERLWDLCHRTNELVLEAGGRFYFAKDSTLRPADVRAYLGNEALECYRQLKARFDPDGILRSALADRLEL
jgi:decaprenylphospho-beta-D-ribofuranose 2-oxidase